MKKVCGGGGVMAWRRRIEAIGARGWEREAVDVGIVVGWACSSNVEFGSGCCGNRGLLEVNGLWLKWLGLKICWVWWVFDGGVHGGYGFWCSGHNGYGFWCGGDGLLNVMVGSQPWEEGVVAFHTGLLILLGNIGGGGCFGGGFSGSSNLMS